MTQWIKPNGYNDPNNKWESETNAYDTEYHSYASSQISPGNSSELQLFHDTDIAGNEIKFCVDRETSDISLNKLELKYSGYWYDHTPDNINWGNWTNISLNNYRAMSGMAFTFRNEGGSGYQAEIYQSSFLETDFSDSSKNLVVSGSNCYFDCSCTEWKKNNRELGISFIVAENNRDSIFSSVEPGAVIEAGIDKGFGYYYDLTTDSSNTIYIYPIFKMAEQQSDRKIIIKNYVEEALSFDRYLIKLVGYIDEKYFGDWYPDYGRITPGYRKMLTPSQYLTPNSDLTPGMV